MNTGQHQYRRNYGTRNSVPMHLDIVDTSYLEWLAANSDMRRQLKCAVAVELGLRERNTYMNRMNAILRTFSKTLARYLAISDAVHDRDYFEQYPNQKQYVRDYIPGEFWPLAISPEDLSKYQVMVVCVGEGLRTRGLVPAGVPI